MCSWYCRYTIFAMIFLSSAEFFFKFNFFKKSFRNTTRVSNSLDPDRTGHSDTQ